MKNPQTTRVAIYITIFVLFFIEFIFLGKVNIFKPRPELLLVITLFFGFHFGMAWGMEVGAVSGLLKDVFSVTTFGVNTALFFFAGLLSGYLRGKIFKENFIMQFFLSALFVMLLSGLYFAYLGREVSLMGPETWRAILVKSLYTGCAAPILFFIFRIAFERSEI